jgi:hypothetical protein
VNRPSEPFGASWRALLDGSQGILGVVGFRFAFPYSSRRVGRVIGFRVAPQPKSNQRPLADSHPQMESSGLRFAAIAVVSVALNC